MLLKRSSLLGSKLSLLSVQVAGRVSQLQDRDNEGRGFIHGRSAISYLSSLENPTDARSIVCDAKEDVLASYQRLPGICTYRSIQV